MNETGNIDESCAIAVPADPTSGKWQPIETAPHGMDVLLGYPNWHTKEWVCEVGQASHGWTRNGVSNMSRHGQATHWMPLPAPPETTA